MGDSKINSGKAVIVLEYTKTIVFQVLVNDFKSFVLKNFVRFKNDAYLKAIPSLHGGSHKITRTVPLILNYSLCVLWGSHKKYLHFP